MAISVTTRPGEFLDIYPGTPQKLTTGTVITLKKPNASSCDTTQKAAGRPVDRFDFNHEYVARLRSNHAETWQHFDGYFRPRIGAKFRARVPLGLVEDLTEEAFVAIVEKIYQGEPQDPACLAGYVLKICDHKALEALRRIEKERYSATDCELLPANGRTPQQQSLSKETAGKVERVLGKLKKRDRDILIAIFYDERDRDELCAEYGEKRDQLKMILFHARRRFQREWQRD